MRRMGRAFRLGVMPALILCLGLCAGAAKASVEEEFGRYRALVIGNNAYEHLTPLKTAVKDAQAVAALLRERYGFEVSLLTDATRDQILDELDRLRGTLTANDNLLIYYAGHGVLDEVTETGYWLPVDADPAFTARWIRNSTITDAVKANSARHVLVVADSCYSGSLARSSEVKLKQGMEPNAWLRRMRDKRSRTLLASGGLEPVADAGRDGHSVFAVQFLEALSENTTVLDGQSLYDRLKDGVVVNADQTPRYDNIHKAGHDGGDFLFVPRGVATAAAERDAAPQTTAPPADRSNLEVSFWESIRDSDDPTDFEDYLATFPNGTFKRLAEKRLATLGAAETQAPVRSREPTVARPAHGDDAESPGGAITFLDPDRSVPMVLKRNANIRVEPSRNAAVRTTLAAGTQFLTPKADSEWLLVQRRDDGQPLGFVYAALAVALPSARFYPASFDCTKAAAPQEYLICSDPNLAALDAALGEEYRNARAYAGSDASARDTLVRSQRNWLGARDAACAATYDDFASASAVAASIRCLEQHTKNRVRELKLYQRGSVGLGDD